MINGLDGLSLTKQLWFFSSAAILSNGLSENLYESIFDGPQELNENSLTSTFNAVNFAKARGLVAFAAN